MQNNWIVTPDLYLAMFGLFAASMVARSLVQTLRLRRARVSLHALAQRVFESSAINEHQGEPE